MKQRVCTERCYKPSISNYSVSILRPVSFQDQKYRQYLQALSTATDGAFQFNQLGDQAIEVISPLRTAEKIFAKNGRIFDLGCIEKVQSTIAGLAMEGVCLNPLVDCQEGAINFKKKDSNYELWMRFKPDSQHQESLLRLADILTVMAKAAGKQIHRDDVELLDANDHLLEMKIGFIAMSDLDDFLLSDIEFAQNTIGYTSLGVISEAYSYKTDNDPATVSMLQRFADNNSSIEFDPLTIGLRQRTTKRSS